jgi:fructokinase
MKIKAVCFGEILWDVFPDKARIGGAPLNVASRLSATGIDTEIISRIGTDQKGKDIIDYLKNNNVRIENIQSDPLLPSGMVNVTLSSSGSASYEIAYPSAWDKIEVSESSRNSVTKADVFIFGSLVCRDKISRNILFDLLELANYKVFDINLRPPHYQKEALQKLIQKADFIKFNDEELFEIATMLGSPFNSLEQNLSFISEKTNTKSICVTKGSHGAVLLSEGKLYYNI